MSAPRRTPPVSVLHVLLGEREIGTLTHLSSESTLFVFNDEYVMDAGRPTFSLSFKTKDGGVQASRRPTHLKVPPFFSNLLPEGHLRDYLAERGGVSPQREFFLLWLLGRDLPGAVVVVPGEGEAMPPEAFEDAPREVDPADAFRFSLAGIQLKFSAVMESDGGLTIPAQGIGGSWIVKLPSARHASVPENEYVMLALARAVGITVPETRLIRVEEVAGLPSGLTASGPALAVRRFDRSDDGARLHMEDFAQVFDLFPHQKYGKASYENLAAILWAETTIAEIAEFARRLAFSAMIGNGDMHLKNWSLIYRDGRQAALAPAYDFVSTVPYMGNDAMALSIAGTKAWSDVSLDLFSRFAAKAGIPESTVLEAVRETASRLLHAWEHDEVVGLLPGPIRKKLHEHMHSVPLATEV